MYSATAAPLEVEFEDMSLLCGVGVVVERGMRKRVPQPWRIYSTLRDHANMSSPGMQEDLNKLLGS